MRTRVCVSRAVEHQKMRTEISACVPVEAGSGHMVEPPMACCWPSSCIGSAEGACPIDSQLGSTGRQAKIDRTAMPQNQWRGWANGSSKTVLVEVMNMLKR